MINHLYVHVPFCNSICSYCDFCHRVYNEKLSSKWLDRLEKEIKDNCLGQYKTIYIGGGTPTSLNDYEFERLLTLIKPYSSEIIEYTAEANPDSLDINKISLLNKYGVNRVSMGIQTSDDDLLKLLNRKHTFKDANDKIRLLKNNGITNISVDFMYSLPGQTMDILKKTLDDFMNLDVPHVSLYSLTVEENTVFGKKGYKPLDNDTEADMYEYIRNYLTENGYIQYEVSNYCRKGYESKHNLGYWNYDDFLGVSLSASSKIGNRRFTNTRVFDEYLNSENIHEEDLVLSKEDMMFENIMMSLRTVFGLNIQDFNRKYQCDLLKKYEKGLMNKYITVENGYLKCTDLEILNSILLDFME